MMFAIIYEKPMKIFATSTAGRAQMSDRMVNFCERLKITEVLAGNIQDEWHFANIQNKNLINDELESWIASSKEFLAKCLR
jgi:hypothetical protein